MSQLRYWTARLKPLLRPSVGIVLLCLSVTGAFIWTALQYPELFSFSSSEVSPEDAESAAIGADIDSSNLFSDRESPIVELNPQDPAKPNITTPSSQPNSLTTSSFPILGGGPINLADPNLNGNTTGVLSSNLNFSNAPNNLANTAANNTSNTSIDQPSIAQTFQQFTLQSDPPLQSTNLPTTWQQFPKTPSQGSTALPPNSLQLDPQNSGFQNSGFQSNGFQNNGLQTSGFQNFQNNGFQNNNGLPSNNWTPPLQGTTGLPTNIPINPASTNAYTNLTNPSAIPLDPGVAAPSGYGMPAVAPVSSTPSNIPSTGLPSAEVPVQPPQQPEQAFTAPRPIPGRIIGGGNINSFSNP